MTTLIDINDITTYFKLNPSLKIEDLEPYIIRVQDRYLKPILCKTTYDSIIDAYENDDFTEDEQVLFNEIVPMIVHRVYSLFIADSNLIHTPQGLKESDDPENTSSPMEAERRGVMVRKANDDADYYKNYLIKFLDANRTTYTVWADSECGCIKQSTANYIQGVGGKKQVKHDLVKISYD